LATVDGIHTSKNTHRISGFTALPVHRQDPLRFAPLLPLDDHTAIMPCPTAAPLRQTV